VLMDMPRLAVRPGTVTMLSLHTPEPDTLTTEA
jgi:hypothetical protein